MKKQTILKSAQKKIKIVITTKHEPKKFFNEPPTGVYVWSGFKENILPKAKTTKEKSVFNIVPFQLKKSAIDAEIENELGKNHLFSETDVCAIIASLIEKQSKGQKGTLLNTGYANLFYTKSRVVGVDWDGDAWLVGAWGRGATAWPAGRRVFSPATES